MFVCEKKIHSKRKIKIKIKKHGLELQEEMETPEPTVLYRLQSQKNFKWNWWLPMTQWENYRFVTNDFDYDKIYGTSENMYDMSGENIVFIRGRKVRMQS